MTLVAILAAILNFREKRRILTENNDNIKKKNEVERCFFSVLFSQLCMYKYI